mmetsp:Transcript_1902/g.3680  ORF Transcript_1902/g.3680 Transcript_1902/m.3680 type:complete len:110 (+) Transcript_1902:668-997(+)
MTRHVSSDVATPVARESEELVGWVEGQQLWLGLAQETSAAIGDDLDIGDVLEIGDVRDPGDTLIVLLSPERRPARIVEGDIETCDFGVEPTGSSKAVISMRHWIIMVCC